MEQRYRLASAPMSPLTFFRAREIKTVSSIPFSTHFQFSVLDMHNAFA
jgi:hypothetical protein